MTLTASDPDGNPVTVTNTAPSQGQVSVLDNQDGTWSYTYGPTDASRLHASLGGDTTDSFTITVTDSHGAYTNVTAGPIAIAPTQVSTATVSVGANVGNGGSQTVSVIDTSNNVTTIDLSGYGPPGSMAVSGTNLYVTSWNSSRLWVIDTTTNTVCNVGSVAYPMGVAVSGNSLYAANYGNPPSPGHRVTKVDLTDGTMLTIDTGGNYPYGVVIKGDRVYVSNSGSDTVSVISTTSNSRIGDPIPVGDRPMGMAVNGDYIYVANFNSNAVTVIDTKSDTVVGLPIPVGSQPYAVAFSPDGSLAFVANFGGGTVSVIDTATNTVVDLDPTDPDVDNIQVGANPSDLAVRSDGTLYVTNSGSTTVSVISFAPAQP